MAHTFYRNDIFVQLFSPSSRKSNICCSWAEGEEVVHTTALCGDPLAEKEKHMCHETFFLSLKNNNNENIALSKFNPSLEDMPIDLHHFSISTHLTHKIHGDT